MQNVSAILPVSNVPVGATIDPVDADDGFALAFDDPAFDDPDLAKPKLDGSGDAASDCAGLPVLQVPVWAGLIGMQAATPGYAGRLDPALASQAVANGATDGVTSDPTAAQDSASLPDGPMAGGNDLSDLQASLALGLSPYPGVSEGGDAAGNVGSGPDIARSAWPEGEAWRTEKAVPEPASPANGVAQDGTILSFEPPVQTALPAQAPLSEPRMPSTAGILSPDTHTGIGKAAENPQPFPTSEVQTNRQTEGLALETTAPQTLALRGMLQHVDAQALTAGTGLSHPMGPAETDGGLPDMATFKAEIARIPDTDDGASGTRWADMLTLPGMTPGLLRSEGAAYPVPHLAETTPIDVVPSSALMKTQALAPDTIPPFASPDPDKAADPSASTSKPAGPLAEENSAKVLIPGVWERHFTGIFAAVPAARDAQPVAAPSLIPAAGLSPKGVAAQQTPREREADFPLDDSAASPSEATRKTSASPAATLAAKPGVGLVAPPSDLSAVTEDPLDAFDDGALPFLTATGPALPGVASSSAGPTAPLPVPQVATQIATALAQNADGSTDLALSPEELGKVHLKLKPDAGNSDRMVIMITFERPETLELFRRHAGELADALRSAGYAGADIGFGQEGSFASGSDRGEGRSGQTGKLLHAESTDIPPAPARRLAGASLDLRL